MAISSVGASYITQNALTLSVTPSAVGNILVLFIMLPIDASSAISSVSGGGVTTWNAGENYYDSTNGYVCAIYWGVITTAGSATITFSGGGATSHTASLAQEFSGVGTWSQDGSGSGSTIGTPGTYPSLTPAGSGELYVACSANTYGVAAGSTAGFTYNNEIQNTNPGKSCAVVWNTSASGIQDPSFSAAYSAVAFAAVVLKCVSISPRSYVISQAVNRASTFFKRLRLWEPERGFLVPEAA